MWSPGPEALPYFNPLRREGGDANMFSIISQRGYFNPLRREGGDSYVEMANATPKIFQSTPPRGRRRVISSCPWYWENFNPLRREGGDIKYHRPY